MKPKVLITGGAGYIGSHTVKILRENKYDVLVYDSLENGFNDALLGAPLVKGQLSDKDLLNKTFLNFRPDVVIHFAAYADVPDSVANPKRYYVNNVLNGMNLLDIMIQNKINKIVFSSSAAVYGTPDVNLISEDITKDPINSYGRSKLTFEGILADYDRAYGIKSVSLRYFCAAGCSQDSQIGESHKPELHLIPVVLRTILGVVKEVEICGTDFPTKDGTGVRDFIHVDDLAAAHIKSLLSLMEGEPSNIFNVGTGLGYSVREVINTAEKVTGKIVKRIEAPKRQGDPAKLVANPEKIKRILGWSPKYDLENMIETAWKWFSKHPNGFEK